MKEKIDLRLQKTYLALHNSFAQLLEEKRFEDLTVNELCERAMIRRTTFYKHFADKYEYFSFYLKEVTATFRGSLPSDATADKADAYLIHMCRELLHFIKMHERLVQNIKTSSMISVLMGIMLDEISSDIYQALSRTQQGAMTKSQIKGTAAFNAGGLINTLFQYLRQDFPLDEEKFMEIITPHFRL